MEMINRRGLVTGLISFVAAPAIVRAQSLMPVKTIPPATYSTYKIGDWISICEPNVSLPSGLHLGSYRITSVSEDRRSIGLGGGVLMHLV